MERINKGFSSLVSCYALLATLACSFLIYAHWAFTAHPPQWADQVGSFVARPSSGHALHLAKALSAIRIAALYFHERAHTTRLYFGVFAAVWLACLLWTLIGRRRRVAIYGRGTVWIGAISLLVVAVAALYGLGTRGVFSQRIPALSRVSDAIAAGFLLALPLITWSRARRRDDDEDLDGGSGTASEVSAHRLARLGFRNEMSNTISVVPPHEGPAAREIRSEGRSADSLAPSQNSQPEDHAMVAANRLIARAAAPVIPEPQQFSCVSSEPEGAALPEPAAVALATSLALTPVGFDTGTVAEPRAPELADRMDRGIAEVAVVVSPEPADANSPEPISEIAAHPFTAEIPEPSAEFPLELAAVELGEPGAVSEPATFMQAESPAPIAAHLVAALPPEPEASLQPATIASVSAEPIVSVLAESTAESGAQTHFRQLAEPVCGVAAHLAAIVVPTAVPETREYPGVLQSAAFQTPEPMPSKPAQPPQNRQATTPAEDNEAPNGAGTFRHDLLGLYRSWQRIETVQGEIDGWFEHRRRQAVAHVATPPAMRTSGLGRDLVRDFPTDKMNEIESEWAEIRTLALEISRSVGELPNPDHDS